jgi:hypothetical protein
MELSSTTPRRLWPARQPDGAENGAKGCIGSRPCPILKLETRNLKPLSKLRFADRLSRLAPRLYNRAGWLMTFMNLLW